MKIKELVAIDNYESYSSNENEENSDDSDAEATFNKRNQRELLAKKWNKSKYKLVDSTKIITGILESTKSSISTISMNLNVK